MVCNPHSLKTRGEQNAGIGVEELLIFQGKRLLEDR